MADHRRTLRQRRPTSFEQMDQSAYQWLVSTARKNLWRVVHWYDLDDLLQDGLMCYHIALTKYPNAVERPHIMRLFMRIYINHLHRLANKRTKQRDEEARDSLADIEAFCPDAELLTLVIQAPETIRQFLITLLSDPRLLLRPCRRYLDGTRESTSQWLRGLLGDAVPDDITSQLVCYLRESDK